MLLFIPLYYIELYLMWIIDGIIVALIGAERGHPLLIELITRPFKQKEYT